VELVNADKLHVHISQRLPLAEAAKAWELSRSGHTRGKIVLAVIPAKKLVYPIIPNVGGAMPLPQAAEQPRPGAKVVFEITAGAKPDEVNKGVVRMARMLNVYGAAGLKATDVKVAAAFHGEAINTVLTDAAYQAKFGVEKNPNLPVLNDLRKAGVEVFVCGQALAIQGIDEADVAEGVSVAAAALTVLISRQNDGYVYVLVP
jgi:intracellular sulfur oxidation DsrE/DsrF family protein